jgi:hypothetical protein
LATSSLVRSRLRLSALAVATIATGLATRRVPAAFPEVLATFGGDVLWATLVYWLLAWLRPSAAAPRLACAAGLAALAVECSQLLHPAAGGAWPIGLAHFVLGQGFLWSDLACYAVGIGLAWALDRGGVARRR